MINLKYFHKIRAELLSYSEKRRDLIKISGDAQHLAKKSIFAAQRGDLKDAEEGLKKSLALLEGLLKKYQKIEGIFDEGAFRAALEEYVEAKLFLDFVNGKDIGPLSELPIDSDLYVSGLCDVPGEIVRYAIKNATERKFAEVKKANEVVEVIINEMIDMDLTGYNRQKFDQAKQALHKLQQIVYEISLKP